MKKVTEQESKNWAELVNIFRKYDLSESTIASMVFESIEGFEKSDC